MMTLFKIQAILGRPGEVMERVIFYSSTGLIKDASLRYLGLLASFLKCPAPTREVIPSAQ